MDKKNDYVEIDVIRLIKAIWSHGWIVAIAAIAGAVIAFSYAALLVTPLYQSSAMMYVNNTSAAATRNNANDNYSINPSELTAAQSLAETYIVILKTRATLEQVIQEAKLPYTYEQLSGMVSASAVNATEVFKVVVTSPNPEEAQRIANTITYVLPDRISEVVDGSSVRTVDYAVTPGGKTSPNKTKYTLIGFLLGLIVSCGLIIIQELMDDAIHGSDYLAETYEIPVLAEIPDLSKQQKSQRHKRYGYGKKYYGYEAGGGKSK